MKGGKSAFPEDFRFTSNPAPTPFLTPSRSSATSGIADPIPDIAITGIRRQLEPLEKNYRPRDVAPSDAIAKFVRDKEGSEKRAGQHVPYIPKGDKFYTIGYGHNLGETPPPAGTVWSERQALDQLKQDMSSAADRVRRLVNVPLTQAQFDALTSLAFNTTEDSFKDSRMLRNLNAGDYLGAATEMLTFDHAGGARLDGLTKRRRAEAETFLGREAHLLPLRPTSK